MKSATLESLEPLLNLLRDHASLSEVRPAEFHLKGRGFLHFHEEPDGLVADVLLNAGRLRMPVTSSAQQAEFLERIADILESLERRTRDGGRRGRIAFHVKRFGRARFALQAR
jgi:hypothetical protein